MVGISRPGWPSRISPVLGSIWDSCCTGCVGLLIASSRLFSDELHPGIDE